MWKLRFLLGVLSSSVNGDFHHKKLNELHGRLYGNIFDDY